MHTAARLAILASLAALQAGTIRPAHAQERQKTMTTAEQGTVTYPAPEGATLSSQYTVEVNGVPVAVYLAPVWEPGYVKSFGGPYSFAYFDTGNPVTVRVTAPGRDLNRVVIRPVSRGIQPRVEGETLTFSVQNPCRLSIEPDAKHGPLLLFVNPLEVDPPRREDPGVVYFGPGLHRVGELRLGDDQTLYVAGGAVVKGGVHAQGRNIRITGRGILDGVDWERFKGPGPNLLRLTGCTDARVDGVILKDSWSWTFPLFDCDGVEIENVKIVSTRCENNDGIGVCNSRNVRIRNCFIRTDDDSITTKGFGESFGKTPYPPVENLVVEDCELWTDRAHVWRLGCECRAEVMRNLTFRNIDVLHYTDPTCPAITVQPAEGMLMADVLFDNIRINGEGQRRFIEIITAPTPWAKEQVPGLVRNVVFRNVDLAGTPGDGCGQIEIAGSDADHTVSGITFENVSRYGRPLTRDTADLQVGEHSDEIVIRKRTGGGVYEGLVQVPGGRVWYRVAGAKQPGIPLLVVHGGPGASHDYLEGLEALAGERPVVFYDQLGCGNSERPDDVSLWTLERFVAELGRVRQELNLTRVHILGQSWGAALATEHALSNSGTGVESLVLSGPLLSTPRWVADQRAYITQLPEDCRTVIELCEEKQDFDDPAYQQAMTVFYQRHLCRLDPWPERVNRTFEKMNVDQYTHMWGPSEFTATGSLKTFDCSDRLEEIRIPVLLTCGEFDEAAPASVTHFGGLFANARVKVFAGASHEHHIEKQSEYLSTVGAFLREAAQDRNR